MNFDHVPARPAATTACCSLVSQVLTPAEPATQILAHLKDDPCSCRLALQEFPRDHQLHALPPIDKLKFKGV